MFKYLYEKFGDIPMWIPATLDYIKNIGAVYLLCAFIGWNLNPMDWLLMNSGSGRFILFVIFFLVTVATFVDEE